MPRVHKIRKGLNLNLAGKAEKVFNKAGQAEFYAVKPTDFHSIVPRMMVKEGDEVKAGSALFHDKYKPEILFTSPVSGRLHSIVRGERRIIEEVIIRSDGKMDSEHFPVDDPLKMKRSDIISTLLKSGLWPSIKQRPYNIVANPSDNPRDIFVSAFDTSPLAPDYDFVILGLENEFRTGINALSRLTDGIVHINVNADYPASNAFTKSTGAQVNYFSGAHPTGNVGVQINHIKPVNKGEVVWVLNVQEVIAIGRLFIKGICDQSRIIALTGSGVIAPKYYKVTSGTAVNEAFEGLFHKGNYRYISGNVLTGKKISSNGYLGYYDSQLTVIPEGDYYEFMGWASPGINKLSYSRTFWSWLTPRKEYNVDTNLHGGLRAFVITGLYEEVLPMDIYPMQLLKAIIAKDIDGMEKMGIYEVAEEDFALCEFVCPSKTEMQKLIRKGLDLIRQEMS